MLSKQEYPTNLFAPVEKVAQLIHNFTRQQKVRLLQLVPELQTIQAEETVIPRVSFR